MAHGEIHSTGDGNHTPPTEREQIEGIASLACDLLDALKPWDMHGAAVRSAAARLTLALASLPLGAEEVAVREP